MRHLARGGERRRLTARAAAALSASLLLGAVAAACGSSATTLPTSSNPGSTTAQHGNGSTSTSHPSGASSTTTTTGASADACDISAILDIAGESTSEDESRTSSWTLKQENNWSIFVPSSSWVISASASGGADAFSPDGLSSSDLSPIDSLSPVTYSEESQQILTDVSDVKQVCQSENSVDANGESKAFEVTGIYNHNDTHEPVHIVYAITISAVTAGSEFHGGEVRLVYGPNSQWSASLAQELWLIIKRAVFVPSEG